MSYWSPYYNESIRNWSTNHSYQEILKLDRMLTEADIPHTLDRLYDGWQVCYPVNVNEKGNIMDVVEHFGSYGSSDDKLEIMGLLTPEEAEHDSVEGYLTAEEIFERIRKHYSGEWDNYIKSLTTITSEEDSEEDSEETALDTTDILPMTPEEFLTQMREAYDENPDDEELVHIAMDNIMCDQLRRLGYGAGIDIFDSTHKWYA